MKKIFFALLVPCFQFSAVAQEAFQAKAIITTAKGENSVVWILESSAKEFRYKTTVVSTDSTIAKISDFSMIYLMEPEQYSEAMDLFEAGKFTEAKEKFVAYKDFSKRTASLKGNFHILSAFYEMECLRMLGDYAGLATALQSFQKATLTRDDQLRQLDLYVMWNALNEESWDRLLILTNQRDDENLPAYQRAQVAFCKAMALHKKEEPDLEGALVEYATAMTVDAGASRVIAQEAALNSLKIYFEDEDVQAAMSNWGTKDEAKGSIGYSRLKEASGLAKIFESFLKVDKELSKDLSKLLTYTF